MPYLRGDDLRAFRTKIGADTTRTGPLDVEDTKSFIDTLLSRSPPDSALKEAVDLQIMLPRFPGYPNVTKTCFVMPGEEGLARASIDSRFPNGTDEIPNPVECADFAEDVVALFGRKQETEELRRELIQFERESGTRMRLTGTGQWSQLDGSDRTALKSIYNQSCALAHQTICPSVW